LENRILKVKEIELKDRGQCQFKNYCRIFHMKHNWKRYNSDNFGAKLDDLHSNTRKCSQSVDVRMHKTTNLEDIFAEGVQSGEVSEVSQAVL
jgi:hypothetical protein